MTHSSNEKVREFQIESNLTNRFLSFSQHHLKFHHLTHKESMKKNYFRRNNSIKSQFQQISVDQALSIVIHSMIYQE